MRFGGVDSVGGAGRGAGALLAPLAALAALMLLGTAARPAAAQDALPLGQTAADGRVQATVTGVRPADSFEGLAGTWVVADVTLTGVSGIKAQALLDWRLRFASGTELPPFPGASSKVEGDEVSAGQTATLQLGFSTAGESGPATLVYQPFLDGAPLGVWAVTVDPPAVPASTVAEPGIPGTMPDVPIPSFDIPVPSVSSGAEQVTSFHAVYDIQADSTILVTETIGYDFGFLPRHGIFRDLALFQPIDSDQERKYPITEVTVSGDEGTPDGFELLRNGDFRRIKIGDKDIEITGRHTYTIGYRMAGALNQQAAGPELYFNVTGRWQVPMSDVAIEVRAPGGVTEVACYAGPTGSTGTCDQASLDGGVARYRQASLDADDQVTIVAALPEGSVSQVGPILGEAPRTLADAVEPGPLNIGGAAGVGALGLAGIGALVWRKGRDLEGGGSAIDAVMDPDAQPARRLPLLRGVETPVEFVPPDGVRPGLLGTLYDEQADAVDVSATIVDLAVRGYLRIEEIPKSGLFGKTDHRFVKLKPADDLLPYERTLFNGLFKGGLDEVELSDLKNTFASTLTKVKESMYAETVRMKWYDRRPDQTRSRWILTAVGVSALGGLAVFGAVATKRWLWPGAALVVVGLVFLVAARWMPRRTARGTSAMRRAEGFRRFIVDSESRRAEFAERKNLFTEYLPYAIVFGCVDKWADTFASLNNGQVPDTGTWYVGTGRFDSHHFSRSMNGFTSRAGATMASTPGGSGGSGFSGGSSGGGGGGGGGGSW